MEMSDLQCSRVECEHCGAIWLDGKHYWSGTCQSTKNSELDLAGLVCNTDYGDASKCKNPMAGKTGGDTWEERLGTMERNLKRLLEEQ